jgi:hypothetical protein
MDPAPDEVLLRNGARLAVRPIRPADADADALAGWTCWRPTCSPATRRCSACSGRWDCRDGRSATGSTVTVLVDLSRSDLPAERAERARRHLARAGAAAPPA